MPTPLYSIPIIGLLTIFSVAQAASPASKGDTSLPNTLMTCQDWCSHKLTESANE